MKPGPGADITASRPWTFLAGCAGLAASDLFLSATLPGFADLPTLSKVVSVGILCSTLWTATREARRGVFGLTVCLVLVCVATLARAGAAPSDTSVWVTIAEAAMLAWAAAGQAGIVPAGVIRFVPGLMLIVFGAVHLIERATVASLVPGWIPSASLIPLGTGGALILLGGLTLTLARPAPVLKLAAALFASWVPLVHLPRLIDDPASPFEWSFAAMCVALTGAMLVAARGCAATGDRRISHSVNHEGRARI